MLKDKSSFENIEKNQIKNLNGYIAQTEKTESGKRTASIIMEQHGLCRQLAMKLLSKFGKEDRVCLISKTTTSQRNSLFSIETAWYWITIVLALITTVIVLYVPETEYPFAYFRSVLGAVLILFLPGYSLTRALFPLKLPFETSSEDVDKIECVILSLGLSIVLSYIVGLILNYTSWGLGLIPITLGMLALTLFLATIGLFRQRSTKQKFG